MGLEQSVSKGTKKYTPVAGWQQHIDLQYLKSHRDRGCGDFDITKAQARLRDRAENKDPGYNRKIMLYAVVLMPSNANIEAHD
jgi:hypothetical protein